MSRVKYKGTGIYTVYSDIYVDVIKRGDEEYIAMNIYDRNKNFVHIPNLLAIKRLRDVLDKLVNMNKQYYKYTGE